MNKLLDKPEYVEFENLIKNAKKIINLYNLMIETFGTDSQEQHLLLCIMATIQDSFYKGIDYVKK